MYYSTHAYKSGFTKQDALKYSLVITYSFISIALISLTEKMDFHILLMWGFTLLSMVICKFSFAHPYFWFSLFFTLYSTSNVVLLSAEQRFGNYSKEQILYPIISLSIVLYIIGPKNAKVVEIKAYETRCNEKFINVLKHVIYILAFITIVVSIILHMRGYTSKGQMKSSGDIFFRYSVHAVRYMTLFVVFYVGKILSVNKKLPWRILIISGSSALIFSLFTSERDVIFRYGYTIIFLLFMFNKLKKKHIPIVAVIAVVGMSVSIIIKHFFLKGTISSGSGNILYDFLSSDFSAAGRNLQYLIEYPGTKGALGYSNYITELLHPLLFGIKTVDPDHWFNYEVHSGGYKGYAFTLVGAGYAIGGLFGIILVFFTAGLIVRFFYKRCYSNIYWLSSYIYLSSAVIFSFRQSLQTITGTLVNHICLAMLFCYVLEKLYNNKSKNGRGSNEK